MLEFIEIQYFLVRSIGGENDLKWKGRDHPQIFDEILCCHSFNNGSKCSQFFLCERNRYDQCDKSIYNIQMMG